MASWNSVTSRYGEDNFTVKTLLNLIETLPKLSLTAACVEDAQGWFTKSGKEKSVHPHIDQFVNSIRSSKTLRTAPIAALADLPNLTKITLGPSDNPVFTDDGVKLTLHVAGACFPAKNAATKLHKLKMTLGAADIEYDMPDENGATTMEDLQIVLSAFKDATSSPTWVFIVFCSFQQMEEVRQELLKVCNLGVEHHFWLKQNVQRNVNTQRSTNVVEVFLVGFFGPEAKRCPTQVNFGKDTYAANTHPCGKVQKPYYYQNKVRFEPLPQLFC